MRTAIAGCALLLIGTAAQAQPYDEGYPPPPPYDEGYGHRPPPPPAFDDGYGRRPPPRFYDGGFEDPPPPPRPRRRRCRIVEDFDGPHRVCRPDF